MRPLTCGQSVVTPESTNLNLFHEEAKLWWASFSAVLCELLIPTAHSNTVKDQNMKL